MHRTCVSCSIRLSHRALVLFTAVNRTGYRGSDIERLGIYSEIHSRRHESEPRL